MRAARLSCAIVALLLVLWWGGHAIAPRILPLVAAVHALGPIGPLFFIFLYVIAVVVLIYCYPTKSSWLKTVYYFTDPRTEPATE